MFQTTNQIQVGAPKIAKLPYKWLKMADITIVDGGYFMVYQPTTNDHIWRKPHPVSLCPMFPKSCGWFTPKLSTAFRKPRLWSTGGPWSPADGSVRRDVIPATKLSDAYRKWHLYAWNVHKISIESMIINTRKWHLYLYLYDINMEDELRKFMVSFRMYWRVSVGNKRLWV